MRTMSIAETHLASGGDGCNALGWGIGGAIGGAIAGIGGMIAGAIGGAVGGSLGVGLSDACGNPDSAAGTKAMMDLSPFIV
jgi:hypothetical protein